MSLVILRNLILNEDLLRLTHSNRIIWLIVDSLLIDMFRPTLYWFVLKNSKLVWCEVSICWKFSIIHCILGLLLLYRECSLSACLYLNICSGVALFWILCKSIKDIDRLICFWHSSNALDEVDSITCYRLGDRQFICQISEL
jgi:hypothetical protein